MVRGPRYDGAAICRRGHVETYLLTYAGAIPPRCATCGAKILTACPACGARIRGGDGSITPEYTAPDFCDHCSSPLPWVSRQGRIYELMNLLDEEDLDPATELEVREQLEALATSDLPDDEQAKRWERVKRKAPGLWENSGAQRIIETVVTATIKSQLGLP